MKSYEFATAFQRQARQNGPRFIAATAMFLLGLFLTMPFIEAQGLREQRTLAVALFGEPEQPALSDIEASRLIRCRLHDIEFRYRVDYTAPVQSFWERLFNRRPTEEVLSRTGYGRATHDWYYRSLKLPNTDPVCPEIRREYFPDSTGEPVYTDGQCCSGEVFCPICRSRELAFRMALRKCTGRSVF